MAAASAPNRLLPPPPPPPPPHHLFISPFHHSHRLYPSSTLFCPPPTSTSSFSCICTTASNLSSPTPAAASPYSSLEAQIPMTGSLEEESREETPVKQPQENLQPSDFKHKNPMMPWGENAQASKTAKLWEEFFSDPSQWWDNRSDKRNSSLPDFRHKASKKDLWIHNKLNPSWVYVRLAAFVPCPEPGRPRFSKPEISVKVEQLWQEFFADPSQWWDNRFIKKNPKYPDYKHKITKEGLWIEGWLNPPWVKAKIATMSLAQIQLFDNGLRSGMSGSLTTGVNVRELCQEGRLKEALYIVELMVKQNIKAPINAYVSLLKSCARRKALSEGKRVHALIVQTGLDSHILIGRTLVDMYATCSSLLDAQKVFNKMPEHNVSSWTAIISAYADHEKCQEAIDLFLQMQQIGIAPDKVAFVVVLKACAKVAALEQGKQLHTDIIQNGFESDLIVGSALLDMYAKCGCIKDARQVFDKMSERDVVSWNAMIAGYAMHGLCDEALALYEQMKQESVQPDNVTYILLLKACATVKALEQGKQLHLHIIEDGFESDSIVGNTLVDMYAKCGCIENALQVFNKISEKNVVSWSTMIAGYAQNGLGKEALALYKQMKLEGVQPNGVTYVFLLKACANIAALEQGKQLHAHIIESGFESDVVVASAIVDMYAKCGCIEHAREVFNTMAERDVVSWNAMIVAYKQQGLGNEALTLLERMRMEGTKPDEITYASVLSACSHSGLVDEGFRLFDSMCKDQGVTPTTIHYACMVDLLGRAGCLANAEDFINKMPIQPDAVVWMTLLGSARNHGHVEIGRRAFDCVMRLEPENAVAYVLLSNIYAEAGRADEVAKIHKKMNNAGVEKFHGCGWIEADNQAHAFVSDSNRPTKQKDSGQIG